MESEGVLLPWIHEHIMNPWNDMRKGDCCGHFESISEGCYCESCDCFFHKKCAESPDHIEHPSHPNHTLWLVPGPRNYCNLCGRDIMNLCYRCVICDFNIDLNCAKYTPHEVIDFAEMHPHKLTLLKERNHFDCCAKCGKTGNEFLYKCHQCDLAFHVDCLSYPLELNHPYHSLHPLKLVTGLAGEYSDGRCRLCGKNIDDKRMYYHCSSCNFSLDMRCVSTPPPQSLFDLKAHEHQLFLLPRLDSFTCNACGIKGDRSPYICVQCHFMIHQECLDLPSVININHHDHRVSRTSVLGILNSVCGVCRLKVDWTYGGYSCQRCPPGYVVHSKCATRKDVWNGKELEGVPEEVEDTEPYVVIDENTIQHFSHKEHYLRLKVNSDEDKKRCKVCTYPISLQSFYGCIMDCDFMLHQNCAGFPKKKWHVLHNEQLSLVSSGHFWCGACKRISNGFMYEHERTRLDVRCGSIPEPFFHPSHPHHPLYYLSPTEVETCVGCNKKVSNVLTCIENDCEFVLGFECATLPQMSKHRVNDHPLSLCYGEEKTSGKYWCDICEKETNPKEWFYTCKDHRASLHTKCVLGEFVGLMPGSTIECGSQSLEVVLNNSITRPVCKKCGYRCIYPIILKLLGTSETYFCSSDCKSLFHW